ncbi:hypothetical protein [uncultured Pontibacter sp.]|uniref:hypothetical protein n=1 Tax=uncultured Pontibacter sp. TaxID=453356 RepID=UPI002636A107|nr:hypothetical protein [uncultured Pontibacter sp.]
MGKLKPNATALITVYICLLLLLASNLLLNSVSLTNFTSAGLLPLSFLIRFSIFWFISFVLALLFFVMHIRLHNCSFSDAEIAQSARVGTFTFITGVCMATASGILFYTLSLDL